jgi:hypothetical protein
MVGYLCCYAILFLIFSAGWSFGWFSERALSLLSLCSFGIGVIQTYVLGNEFGTSEGRFTTFTDAQGFAQFLISILALLLFRGTRTLWRYLAIAASVFGIVLTGSRYVFVATILLVLVVLAVKAVIRRPGLRLPLLLKGTAAGFAVVVLLVSLLTYLPENRINELTAYLTTRGASVEDIGTLAWRLTVYEEAVNQIASRAPLNALVGSGTSSGGNVLLGMGSQYEDDLDPNRSIHNEFLRAFYEWGVVGVSMLFLFLGQIARISWGAYKVDHSWQAIALLSIFPALLLSLATENILSGAGRAGGTGYVLVLAALFASLSAKACKDQHFVRFAP